MASTDPSSVSSPASWGTTHVSPAVMSAPPPAHRIVAVPCSTTTILKPRSTSEARAIGHELAYVVCRERTSSRSQQGNRQLPFLSTIGMLSCDHHPLVDAIVARPGMRQGN